jgi:Major capsid protein 13-like
MALSDLAVFNETLYTSMTEILQEQVELMNQATQFGLRLVSGNSQGDYSEESFFKYTSGLVRRRNPYGSGTVTAKDLSQDTNVSVKVAAGTHPVPINKAWYSWALQNPAVAAAALAQQIAVQKMQDMVTVAIGSAYAALSQVSDVITDVSATSTASLAGLNTAVSKFGDMSQNIVCWVMSSKCLFDIYGAALTNSNNLFTYGTVRVVQDMSGRPFVISDNSALYTVDGVSSGVNKYHVLGLSQDGVKIVQNNDFNDNWDTSNGDENISTTYQSEWSFNAGVKGFSWDTVNGSHAPSNAALFTATNWDRTATSHKDLAGVVLEVK